MSDFDDFGNSDDGFDFPDDDDGVFPGDDDDGDGFPSGSDGEMQAELTPEEELKNEYDIAKAEEDDAEAIRALMAIVDREEEVLGEKGKRGFKCLLHVFKCHFKLGNLEECLSVLDSALQYLRIPDILSETKKKKSIQQFLDTFKTCKDEALQERFLNTMVEFLAEVGPRTLWASAYLRLGDLYFRREQLNKANVVVSEIKKYSASVGSSGAKYQIEALVLQAQIASARKDYKKIEEIYEEIKEQKEGVLDDKTKALINEFGGKMYMARGEYDTAYFRFKESFMAFNNSASDRRIPLLKYMILAAMLHTGEALNVFGENETLVFKDNRSIQPMALLLNAYEQDDVLTCERIIGQHKREITGDPFIATYIQSMLMTIRGQVLLNKIQPYNRLKISFLSKVEDLIIAMILDDKINGKLDQVNKVLVLKPPHTPLDMRYLALDRTVTQISSLLNQVTGKLCEV